MFAGGPAACLAACLAVGLAAVGATVAVPLDGVTGAGAAPAVQVERLGLDLRVMTYNLRYASARPPDAWPDRRPVMRELIRAEAPDVLGTQEGLYGQLRDLERDLPDYAWIGLGRDGGSRGEFMAVFYRRDRFDPVAFDHFWLSDTPNVIGSSTWGNSNRRMVTWVRLREKVKGQEFLFWNTHLDHEIEEARQKGARLIRERIAAAPAEIPLILVGDFNCAAAGSVAFDTLVRDGGLADAWALAARRVNERVNTFNGFRAAREEGVRIDWILVRGRVDVPYAATVTFERGGQRPSDHFPVVAHLRF